MAVEKDVKLLNNNLDLNYEICYRLPQCVITAKLRHDGTYKLFSRHSWYIAIAHIHFFGRPAKLGILILLAELRLHDLYVDGVMGGGLNIQLG